MVSKKPPITTDSSDPVYLRKELIKAWRDKVTLMDKLAALRIAYDKLQAENKKLNEEINDLLESVRRG